MINEPELPTLRHRKQVAVLLVRHLFEALRQRRIEVSDSEPHWLTPWQYRERGGGIELVPGNAVFPSSISVCLTGHDKKWQVAIWLGVTRRHKTTYRVSPVLNPILS